MICERGDGTRGVLVSEKVIWWVLGKTWKYYWRVGVLSHGRKERVALPNL